MASGGMTQSGFQWGPGGRRMTPEQIAEARRTASGLAQSRSRVATNPWEGLAQLANAWSERQWRDQSDAAEATGRAEYSELASALLSDPSGLGEAQFAELMMHDFATPQGQALASALMQRGWAADDRALEWGREDARWAEGAALRDAQLAGALLGNERAAWEFDQIQNPPPAPLPYEIIDGQVVQIDPMAGTTALLGDYSSPDATTNMQNFDFLVGRGLDEETALDRAFSGGVNVSVGAEENEFNKAMGRQFGERYAEIQTQANASSQMMGLLDIAEQALATGVYTGFGAEQLLDLQRLGNALGIEGSENIGAAELVRSVQNRMALIMRSPDSGMGMPGAVSDRDITFLKNAQIGLDRSPEGNRAMLQAYRALEQRKIEIAEMADAYVAQHGKLDSGFNQLVRDYAETNPIFGDGLFTQPASAQPGDNVVDYTDFFR